MRTAVRGNEEHRLASRPAVLLLACALICLIAPAAALARAAKPLAADQLNDVKRFVVIYQENDSFDGLFGGWEGVDGLANARPSKTIQIDQHGTPLTCLLQVDPELAKQPTTCDGTDAG